MIMGTDLVNTNHDHDGFQDQAVLANNFGCVCIHSWQLCHATWWDCCVALLLPIQVMLEFIKIILNILYNIIYIYIYNPPKGESKSWHCDSARQMWTILYSFPRQTTKLQNSLSFLSLFLMQYQEIKQRYVILN